MEIFVGNLAFTTTDQDVRQLFEPYGVVERVHIPQERDTGRLRGFWLRHDAQRYGSPGCHYRAPGGDARGTDLDGQ